MSKTHALSKKEQAALDAFAESNAYFSKLRAGFAEYDSLTERQYDSLVREMDRVQARKDWAKLDGIPVANKHKTHDGKVRCAAKSCDEAAVLKNKFGALAYCEDCAPEGQAEFERFKAVQGSSKSSSANEDDGDDQGGDE